MREQILETLRSHAIGHINKHKMNVEVYLTHPVGIGEHSDIIEAIEVELKAISEYEDQLEIIAKYFGN
jgi:hypothetical protein